MSDEVKKEDASETYEHKFLSSFNIGDNYVGVWRVKSTELKTAAGGKNKYTEYYLQDKSDTVKAVFFGQSAEVKEGDFALVDLTCQDYNGTKSFKVQKILPNDEAVVMSYYLDVFDVQEYVTRLDDVLVQYVKNKSLVVDILKQYDFFNDEGTVLRSYPSNNQKYNKAGGAIAHSVCMAEACAPLAILHGLSQYEMEVLIVACLLGRIGAQYCFDQVNEHEYTPNKEYHLFGVDSISARLVAIEIANPELAEFRDRVLHCLVANEVTDCKPLTKEAFLYTKLVYMDTLLRGFNDSYNKSYNQTTEFSMRDPDFKRQFYIEKPKEYVSDTEDDMGGLLAVETGPIEDRDPVEVEKALKDNNLVLESTPTPVPVSEDPPF